MPSASVTSDARRPSPGAYPPMGLLPVAPSADIVGADRSSRNGPGAGLMNFIRRPEARQIAQPVRTARTRASYLGRTFQSA